MLDVKIIKLKYVDMTVLCSYLVSTAQVAKKSVHAKCILLWRVFVKYFCYPGSLNFDNQREPKSVEESVNEQEQSALHFEFDNLLTVALSQLNKQTSTSLYIFWKQSMINSFTETHFYFKPFIIKATY